MLQITTEFKEKVRLTLVARQANFPDDSDSVFAKKFGIPGTIYSRVKKGDITKVLSDSRWLHLGRELGIHLNQRPWNIARTDVFETIEEDVLFCKEFSKARICVDECEIGKTTTGKYLSRTLQNCFYVDASQAKTAMVFIRLLAKSLGLDAGGRYADLKADIKYYLHMLERPVVIIDEAGDLDYEAFLVVKELWNGTENTCGWYMMGAEGFRDKIAKGIRKKGVGFKEIFSRFSSSYTSTVPIDRSQKTDFYRKLISDVLSVNMKDKAKLPEIVKRCLIQDESGQFGGLRRAESLLILMEGGDA